MIGNEDALKGIWCSMGESQGILIKAELLREIGKSQSQEQGEYQHTVNLIKEAQILRASGSIKDGLNILEKALSMPELNAEFED